MGIKRYQDLEVWKLAHQAMLATYVIIETFPVNERFNLADQMRRAALSVPANIVEGFGRRKPKDKMRFYNMSQSSLQELEYFYRVARDRGYVSYPLPVNGQLDSIGRMLTKLIQKTPDLPSSS